MKSSLWAMLCLPFCLALNGCAGFSNVRLPTEATQALDQSDEMELYSLSPFRQDEPTGEQFHQWPILGSVKIASPADRQELVEGFRSTFYEPNPALCFNPRHGLRITHQGNTFDFVICFECGQFHLFAGDDRQSFEIADKTPPIFNELLERNEIETAE